MSKPSREFPAPAEWYERITDYLAGRLEPEPARLAATVVLMRNREDGAAEVYVVKRAATMAFAAGRYAFPGGRVDPQDADGSVPWSGPSPADWASAFDCGEAEARALVCAAVRETFEETGVLFAGPDASSVVGETSGDEWEADRRALETRELTLAELLRRRSLVMRTDLLGAWSRWVTPPFEPRRYDTAFFVAAMPGGQQARDVSGEADETAWVEPAQALADLAAGRVSMLPPTLTTLREMQPLATGVEALAAAAARKLEPIVAQVEKREDGTYMLVWPLSI